MLKNGDGVTLQHAATSHWLQGQHSDETGESSKSQRNSLHGLNKSRSSITMCSEQPHADMFQVVVDRAAKASDKECSKPDDANAACHWVKHTCRKSAGEVFVDARTKVASLIEPADFSGNVLRMAAPRFSCESKWAANFDSGRYNPDSLWLKLTSEGRVCFFEYETGRSSITLPSEGIIDEICMDQQQQFFDKIANRAQYFDSGLFETETSWVRLCSIKIHDDAAAAGTASVPTKNAVCYFNRSTGCFSAKAPDEGVCNEENMPLARLERALNRAAKYDSGMQLNGFSSWLQISNEDNTGFFFRCSIFISALHDQQQPECAHCMSAACC